MLEDSNSVVHLESLDSLNSLSNCKSNLSSYS
jgi:hypothetical protein